MSESTKATIEILEHYHHNGGFYEIPVEVINTVEQELEEQDKEIERLNNIIDELEKEIDRLLERQYESERFAEENGFCTYLPAKENLLCVKNKLHELKGNNNGVWVNNLLEVIKENNIEFGSDKE